jgi:hypothetical protein
MYKFKNYAFAAIGILALVLAITLVNTKRAGAQQTEAIARPPAKPASPVEVVNTPSVFVAGLPLPVFDIDNARQPFQTSAHLFLPNGGAEASGGNLVARVPDGKRLVIERISANGVSFPANSNLKFTLISISTSVNGAQVEHDLAWNNEGLFGGNTWFQIMNQSLRLYADPNSTIAYNVNRNSNQLQSDFKITLSGYLVDVAQFQDMGR